MLECFRRKLIAHNTNVKGTKVPTAFTFVHYAYIADWIFYMDSLMLFLEFHCQEGLPQLKTKTYIDYPYKQTLLNSTEQCSDSNYKLYILPPNSV